MTMPSPLVALVLVLAAYRLTRLAGWDDFPLAVRVRAWVIGEGRAPIPGAVPLPVTNSMRPFQEPERPGVPVYARPTLAHMVFCPFCIGWWISLATWVAWLCWHPVEYGLMPFAISGAVGLISKNLDP